MNKLVHQVSNDSSKQIRCLQCDLREFQVENVPLFTLWIRENPLDNHILSFELL